MRLLRRTILSPPASNCSIARLGRRAVKYALGDQIGVDGDLAGRAVHGGQDDGGRDGSVIQLLREYRDLQARFTVGRS
ncbi:hypothetical protein ABKV19_009162 [Rosa sericea]